MHYIYASFKDVASVYVDAKKYHFPLEWCWWTPRFSVVANMDEYRSTHHYFN